MIRTQIYLTEQEHTELRRLSRQFKQSQSELIRQAIDHFIEKSQQQNRTKILQAAAGLWSDLKSPQDTDCLLYTSPSPRDMRRSRMPSSA